MSVSLDYNYQKNPKVCGAGKKEDDTSKGRSLRLSKEKIEQLDTDPVSPTLRSV